MSPPSRVDDSNGIKAPQAPEGDIVTDTDMSIGRWADEVRPSSDGHPNRD